ncbi:GFA family protein [Mesorhizobium sp. BAC0120]|uniref:GFA family protein n=1 Tax=Mesorhizobium sp. BAC0120 TaxID=3090670 RepID=UPI00298D5DA0|nr:GFA family protein [Mesorhizobium sp. BAC0120]MDW6024698.1 GFA family protein [Mesorhizobium sp. BAC0120]
MTTRRASCSCGSLQVACAGEPARTAICHCLECQRRTGAVFGNQAFFKREQIISISGATTHFTRLSGSGRSVTFRFCPTCGSTVYWEAEALPGMIAVAVGSFADPTFAAPQHSVWERRRHVWVAPFCDTAMQHSD